MSTKNTSIAFNQLRLYGEYSMLPFVVNTFNINDFGQKNSNLKGKEYKK